MAVALEMSVHEVEQLKQTSRLGPLDSRGRVISSSDASQAFLKLASIAAAESGARRCASAVLFT
jgi:hypothetical protein